MLLQHVIGLEIFIRLYWPIMIDHRLPVLLVKLCLLMTIVCSLQSSCSWQTHYNATYMSLAGWKCFRQY